jgi:putative effector of murein hydrolase LrgA (UPF0299 family)
MVIAVSTLALMLATALTVVMLKKNKKHKCWLCKKLKK